ncbi:hypothetical protein [Singulisphaera sp. PoT]|uniref:hypothetical protein n=1 Tax=Singulisphaera sp. PoT TaxID=3411797 RepID=UPI003BF49A65
MKYDPILKPSELFLPWRGYYLSAETSTHVQIVGAGMGETDGGFQYLRRKGLIFEPGRTYVMGTPEGICCKHCGGDPTPIFTSFIFCKTSDYNGLRQSDLDRLNGCDPLQKSDDLQADVPAKNGQCDGQIQPLAYPSH